MKKSTWFIFFSSSIFVVLTPVFLGDYSKDIILFKIMLLNLMSFISFLLFIYISIYIHEFGHALAGWLVGFPIKKITIGMGKNIWKGHINLTSTDLVINQGFEGGLTYMGDVSRDWIRIKFFVFALGGVGIQSLLVWLGWQIKQSYMFFHWPIVPSLLFDSFIDANIFLIVFNLLPFQTQSFGIPIPTDGLQLLKVFFYEGRGNFRVVSSRESSRWDDKFTS